MNNNMRIIFFKALILSLLISPVINAETITVKLDLKEQGEKINLFIYGQFIEHLGRCIYGGIWAEMLEDRKFYFPITEKYAPYVNLTDTDYPVVGASPWEIVGDSSLVTMVEEDSFVGDHTPRLKKGAAIRQNDLGVVSGKKYAGYIWLRPDSEGETRVKVSLEFSGDRSVSKVVSLKRHEYIKKDVEFLSIEDTGKAILKIEAIKGDVFVGTVSLMPKDNINGMRKDTIMLLKELNAPLYRWPGGNFTSGYEWRDGIGDRDRRPPRKNPAWTGVEHNDFGTDEFIAFCREIDTEPMIAANSGLGDAHSAAEWVDYCNSGPDTTGGRYRISNGHRKPFNVKYWCVGNEMFGEWQLGFMQLKHYTIKHNMFARAMWKVDPDLVLVGVGDAYRINEEYDPDSKQRKRTWSRGMLEDSVDWMSMLSEHFYVGRVPWGQDGRKPVLEHVQMAKNAIRERVETHKKLQASVKSLDGRFVPIALDEWNYWHRNYVYGELGCIYDLQDALGIAMGLHEFYRQSKYIHAANYAQTVNVIGAIKTTDTEAEFASTGLVLKLYRNRFGSKPLKFKGEIGHLDVMAALNEAGDILTVSLVNPTGSEVTLKLEGVDLPPDALMYVITGEKDSSFNAPGKKRGVNIHDLGTVSITDGLKAGPLSASLWEISL
ncbi:alpha-L-arabinofuranosidase C-terminal domain-containing protein [Thermodesulfobacteriota bacterium]